MDAQVQLAPLWLAPTVVGEPGPGVGDQLEMQALASLRRAETPRARRQARRISGLECPNCRAGSYAVVIDAGVAGQAARGACSQCGARGRAPRPGP
jgi:hypothetical protein